MRIPHPSNWLLPAVLGIAAIAVAATPLGQRVDLALFDLSARLSPTLQAPKVVLITIDDASAANLGAAVWKPAVQAVVLQRVLAAGASAVGYLQFEPTTALAPDEIHDLRNGLNQAGEAVSALMPQLDRAVAKLERASQDLERFISLVHASDRVFLPAGMAATAGVGTLGTVGQVVRLQDSGAKVAHVDLTTDQAGEIRSFAIKMGGARKEVLAMPLALAERSAPGYEARYADAADGQVWLPHSSNGDSAVVTVPVAEIVANPLAAKALGGKVVLIGSAAVAVTTRELVSADGPVASAIAQARAVSQVLTGSFAVRSGWHDGLGAALCVGMAVLAWRMRRESIRTATAISTVLALLLMCGQVSALITLKMWFSSVAPALFALALPLCALARPGAGERGPVLEKSASHGDDRLLALAFHEQGQLDHAFEHLRKCPTTEAVLDDLYELGLDYERRRQYAKAQQVFDYISARSPQRRELLKRSTHRPAPPAEPNLSEAIPGSAQPSTRKAFKPAAPGRLGRYELGRELGRGAMGVVYFGRDTTIGRAVAIKTMPLSQEFDAAELETVKRRFFGEAESAGRLNHPNIVTIYDAGEDQDLAYIAMELLTGKDLSRYTAASRLLPLAVVLSIAARVADALDYAHRLNIVHRDIKPGNIMFDQKTDTVKVTDFGIARITDSNKTKTGMVLGTPSFMSPEQLAGKKIDGQSDLYSLGVTLYQLACGTLPFQAASLAQLMYKISNDPPADPLSHNPSLPDELVAILDRALAKDKQQRFASGAEMAVALRDCASHLATVDIAL